MQLGSSSRAHYGRHHRVSRHETPSGAALRDRPSQQKQHHQQHHKQQRHVSLAAAAASVDASSLVIGYTTPEQYFPVSDLHTAAFHEPTSSPNDRLWKVFDRIWALQINASLARRGAGRCVLLVAFDPQRAPPHALQPALAAAAAAAADTTQPSTSQYNSGSNNTGSTTTTSSRGSSNGNSSPSSSEDSNGSSSSSSSSGFAGRILLPPDFAFPQYGYWLSRLVDRTVWPGLGSSHEELGIVGVAQVDTFGDIIPPRTLSPQRDGAFGWVPRQGYAYISNVAVSPAARRQGVAARLMAEAESVAAAWGCDKAGLHVNPSNAPALGLYRSLQYKKGALEAPWMPYLQGRGPDRCMLMLKRLPTNTRQQKEEQQLQEQQQQLQEQQQQQAELLGRV